MNPIAQLTRREDEVGELLAWGASPQEIGDILFIEGKTVGKHVENIYRKTECHKATEFSAWWFCKKYGLSFDLSPRKIRTIAFVLFMLLIPSEIITTNVMLRTRTVKVTSLTSRIRRNDETDYQYLS